MFNRNMGKYELKEIVRSYYHLMQLKNELLFNESISRFLRRSTCKFSNHSDMKKKKKDNFSEYVLKS